LPRTHTLAHITPHKGIMTDTQNRPGSPIFIVVDCPTCKRTIWASARCPYCNPLERQRKIPVSHAGDVGPLESESVKRGDIRRQKPR
jgi:hypothetical protein